MARNGSGTFTLLNTVAPPGQINNPTNINATMADIASGLTDSVNKDGTKPFAANQPMAGFKFTGSGAGAATTDLARVDQAQSGVVTHATTVGGTVDAITLAFTPTLASLPTKMKFRWTSAGVNTTTTPTITADGFGPYTIKKGALAALAASDLGAVGQINEGVFDGTQILLISSIPAAAFTGGTLTTSTLMSGKDFREAKGAAVASAGTTDIWTPADGNFVHITGTTTITSLGTAHQAGEERTVIFDNILTLTHNATSLILPGAANITTAAGDRMGVWADTTANMIVVNYTRASGQALATAGPQVNAWANFHWNGSAVVIDSSFNVTSIVRNSAGVYTLTMTTAAPSANYVISGSVSASGGNQTTIAYTAASNGGAPTIKTTTAVQVITGLVGVGAIDAAGVAGASIMVIGG